MEEKKGVQTGSQKTSQAKESAKESTEHYRSNNAYRTEDKGVLNSTNKTPEITDGIKVQTAKTQIPTAPQQKYTNPVYSSTNSKVKSTEQMQTGGQTINQAVQRTVEATKQNSYQTNVTTETQKANRAEINAKEIVTPQTSPVIHASVYSNNGKTSMDNIQTDGQTINQAVQRTVEATKQNSYQTNVTTETQKVNMATANTQAISRPHVVAGNVRGIATLSKPVSTVGNASTGNVQTGSQKQQEAIQRASEISKKGSYQTTIQTGNQREKDIGRQSRLAPYQNKKIGLNLGTGNIKSALHFAESALDKQDDLATQSVSSSMRSAEMTYTGVKTGWKMSQKTSDMLVKVAGGTYTVGLATITIKRSTQTYLQTAQYFPVGIKDIPNMIHMNAEASGLINRPIYQGIVHTVGNIQNRVNIVKTDLRILKAKLNEGKAVVQRGARTVVDFSVKLKNGTATGKEAMAILKQARMYSMMGIKKGATISRKALGKGMLKTGKLSVKIGKGTLKGGKFVASKASPHVYSLVDMGISNMMQSEDIGVASLGYAGKAGKIGIKAGKLGVQTGIKGVKATKATVKTSVKAGKAVKKGFGFIRNNGLKAAWEKARYKAMRAVSRAGGSVATALMNSIKMIFRKAMLPVLVISVIVMLATGVIQAPIAFIGAIFSSTFETEMGEQDIREYITNPDSGIPKLVEELKADIANRLSSAQKKYNIVRYKANTGTTTPVVIGSKGELIGNFEVTAYCTCHYCCHPYDPECTGQPSKTASGTTPTEGRTIAVDTSVIPLGTKVYFNNHTYVAEDTGGAIKGNRIDLFFNSHQAALAWGRQTLPVYYSDNSDSNIIDQVTSGFPTNEQLANMIQPVFNAVVLMDYDLEPTEGEAKALLKDIFNTLFRITSTTSTEYCGQSIETGEGTVNRHSCGEIHALLTCPNASSGKHNKYTCPDCCYKVCPGHEKRADYVVPTKEVDNWIASHKQFTVVSKSTKGDKTTITVKWIESDNGCQDACNGYRNCNGHSVISYTLNMEGAYALTSKYFLDPINELSNIPDRTEEQEKKLQDLKGFYEIYQEYMKLVSTDFGGGIGMDDLSGVDFINGSRPSGQKVIDLALSQVGQQGGEPYWRHMGFNSRVEWCACFVDWCMRNSGIGDSYPTTSNNAYCPTLVDWFRNNGRWGNNGYTDLVAGDAIFFDWDGDGVSDHIGLVIGRDGSTVYTVEGNSGDAVAMNSYPLGSSVILGYGLMNFPK